MRHVRWAGLVLAALVLGLAIALVDSSPGWDDTGITATALLLACALFGAAGPAHAWLWAAAVGMWIPALNIARHHDHPNYGSLLALAFAYAGAYGGAFARKSLAGAGGPDGRVRS
jgi:hypothetical protein